MNLPGEHRQRLSGTPLFPVLLVNLVSLLLYLTAPIDWGGEDVWRVILIVVGSQFAISFGFSVGYGRGNLPIGIVEQRMPTGKWFTFLLGAYVVTLPVHYSYIAKTAVSSPFELAAFFRYLWTDPTLGRRIVLDPDIGRTVRWSVFFLISLFNRFFFTLSFILWARLVMAQRVAVVVLLIVEIWFWLAAGTSFGIVVLASTYVFARMVALKGLAPPQASAFRVASVYAAVGLLALTVFLYNLYTRSGKDFINDSFALDELGVQVNSNSPVFSIVPDVLLGPYMYILSYMCQGLHHMSLAFDLEFVWTRFFGSIPGMMDFAAMAGGDQWENTYMYRLGGRGVDPLMNWHSAYTWYANDVTFLGVPVLLGFFGYFLGFCWARSRGGDLVCKVMVVVFGNALFYLWANNTYLSSVFYPLMFLFPYWLVSRIVAPEEHRLIPD